MDHFYFAPTFFCMKINYSFSQSYKNIFFMNEIDSYCQRGHFSFSFKILQMTHEHLDAVLGLDDIRAVQPFSPTNEFNPTSIYLAQETKRYLCGYSFFPFSTDYFL